MLLNHSSELLRTGIRRRHSHQWYTVVGVEMARNKVFQFTRAAQRCSINTFPYCSHRCLVSLALIPSYMASLGGQRPDEASISARLSLGVSTRNLATLALVDVRHSLATAGKSRTPSCMQYASPYFMNRRRETEEWKQPTSAATAVISSILERLHSSPMMWPRISDLSSTSPR